MKFTFGLLLIIGLVSVSEITSFDCKDDYTCTALDDYVWRDDPTYSYYDTEYSFRGEGMDGLGYTCYVLNMTSQSWLTPEDSSQPIWWHNLAVIVPDNLKHTDQAVMWVTGGHNSQSYPDAKDEDIALIAAIAMHQGVIAASLFQVPNEPITFQSDPTGKSRSEDAIIAYTWDQYLNDPYAEGQTEWILQLPMTKAGVKAMDTVEDYVLNKFGHDINNGWIVSGASKRGWACWLIGAVDPNRVKGIAPIVFDDLNFVENLHHHYRSYGGWTWTFEDYYEMNITARLDTKEVRLLMDIIDPIAYAERYEGMPKIVFDSGMDEFFVPDDSRYWWDAMPGPKWFVMSPNTEHSYVTGIFEAVPAMSTFAGAILEDRVDEIPTIDWTIDDQQGTIEVNVLTDQVPTQVNFWYATTCERQDPQRRDWRIATLDNPCNCGIGYEGYCAPLHVFWFKEELELNDSGKYSYTRIPPRDDVWQAAFIDVIFEDENASSAGKLTWPVDKYGFFEFTTTVMITPNVFPFEDCSGADCKGELV